MAIAADRPSARLWRQTWRILCLRLDALGDVIMTGSAPRIRSNREYRSGNCATRQPTSRKSVRRSYEIGGSFLETYPGSTVLTVCAARMRALCRLRTPAIPSRLKQTIALLCAHVESGRHTIDGSSAVALEMRWNANRFIAIRFHKQSHDVNILERPFSYCSTLQSRFPPSEEVPKKSNMIETTRPDRSRRRKGLYLALRIGICQHNITKEGTMRLQRMCASMLMTSGILLFTGGSSQAQLEGSHTGTVTGGTTIGGGPAGITPPGGTGLEGVSQTMRPGNESSSVMGQYGTGGSPQIGGEARLGGSGQMPDTIRGQSGAGISGPSGIGSGTGSSSMGLSSSMGSSGGAGGR